MVAIACTIATINFQFSIFAQTTDDSTSLSPELPHGELPTSTKEQIIADAAKRSQIPATIWKIEKIRTIKWNQCHGGGPSRGFPGICMDVDVYGWEVLVTSPGQRWVYYVNDNGFELDSAKSVPPSLVKQAVRTAALRGFKLPNNFSLHQAHQRTWQDSCLNLNKNRYNCVKATIPGWEIQVMDNASTLWVFHTGLNQDVRFSGSSHWEPHQ